MLKHLSALSRCISTIIHSGIQESFDKDDISNIKLTNQFALFWIFISTPYAFIFYFIDPKLGLFTVPFLVFYALVPILNRYHFYKLSRINFLLWANLGIIFFSCTLGKEMNIQMLYLAYICMPILIFKHSEKYFMYLCILIPLCCFALLNFSNYSIFNSININQTYSHIIAYTVFIAVSSLLLLFLTYFKKQYLQLTEDLNKNNVELKKSYDQLKQTKILTEKASEQAAFATLTQGIAHEIRNPMGMMLSSAEIIIDNMNDKTTLQKYAGILKENILRLNKVTTNMLKFGNPVPENRETTNLITLIENTLELSSPELSKRNISINFNKTPVHDVHVDPASIHQILLNIFLNAIQAIEENGTITINVSDSTKIIEGTEIPIVILECIDSGKGVAKEKLESIFDPFFTSKYGSIGLGLSIVLRVMKEHNGTIAIDSAEDVGTKVTLTFTECDIDTETVLNEASKNSNSLKNSYNS